MNEPEPLDEKLPVPVEIRGGDRDEDFMPRHFHEPGDISAMHHTQNADGSFCCEDDEDE
jgi:hypothetical protein